MSCEDRVERGVLGDASEGDVRHPFVDKAASNPFGFVLKFVVVVGACQEALPGQGGRNATRINHYPSPTPLFGDVSGGATAAGGVEDEVAGVGGHEETTLDDFGHCLNDIHLVCRSRGVCPIVG